MKTLDKTCVALGVVLSIVPCLPFGEATRLEQISRTDSSSTQSLVQKTPEYSRVEFA